MIHFLFRKFLHTLVVLLGVTVITFLLMHAIPGSPWNNFSQSALAMQNIGIDQTVIKTLNQRFGMDLPLWRQYTRYMVGDIDENGQFFCGAVCGNLGPSASQRGRTVQDILFAPPENQTFWQSRFGYSIRLVLLGALIAVGLGVPLGILASRGSKSTLSRMITLGLAALNSIPNFVLGLLAILVLAVGLKIMRVLPDWNIPSHWIIPAIILAAMPMASIARVTQAALANIRGEDYIRTAHAKGLSQTRVTLVHVLRNALVPIITFLGPTLVELFTGLFIVENLFSFPGFGREYWAAILALDYPMIMGLTLIFAIAIVLVNILVEILCNLLDPRLRILKEEAALQ